MAHQECPHCEFMAHQECPQCEFLLSVEGVIAMQRAKGKPACLLIRTTSVVVIHLIDSSQSAHTKASS